MSERGQEPEEREQDTSAGTSSAADEDGSERAGDSDSGPDSEDGQFEAGSTKQPGADPEDAEEIEKERQQRLDPQSRPDNAEVDNTDRDFDPTKGKFADSEGYEETPSRFPDLGGQGA